MSLKAQQITKEATAKRAPAAPVVANRVRGLAGNHTMRAQFGSGRAAVRSYARVGMQPKLTVNKAGDIYEQEADRVAERVMRMAEPTLQRTCECGGGCPLCLERNTHERLQRKAVEKDDSETSVPALAHEVLRSSGQPLDSSTRAFMEPRFGHDFNGVRVHTDPLAAESAQAVNAIAYTVGRNVVFGRGRYQPTSTHGRRLLAHELAHVVQQDQSPNKASLQRQDLPCCPSNVDKKRKKKSAGDDEGPLRSPRFTNDPILQKVLLGELTRGLNDQGEDVRRIKEALIDAGSYGPLMLKATPRDAQSLTTSNTFDRKTRTALKRFQRRAGLKATGILDAKTLRKLDERFPPLPKYKDEAWPDTWNMNCLLKILCPWNMPLVKRLGRGEVPVVKSDSIILTYAKKIADGSWQAEKKQGKGLEDSESGAVFLNKDLNCAEAAITLYHEMWHVDQPKNAKTLDKEVDAEFSDLEWALDRGLPVAEKYLEETGEVSHAELKAKIEELYQNKQGEALGLRARITKQGKVSVRPPRKARLAGEGTLVQAGVDVIGPKRINAREWDCDPSPCRWCWPKLKLPKINLHLPKHLFKRARRRWKCRRRKGHKGKPFCPEF